MMNRNYHGKRPRPHALAPREHYYFNGKTRSYKPKRSFENEASARDFANSHYRDITKVVIYKCTICNQYHIHVIHDDKE